MTTNPEYDVIIIGGGAAGLAAAVTLGRARRRVLVVDAGRPRNAPAEHAHNYLGLEGIPPLELLRRGREEAQSYGAEIRDGSAISATKSDAAFTVDLADGTAVTARRLLVTTGLTDELPDIDGLAERWGREVLHCPFCHGWEVREKTVGIIGSPFAAHQALMWRQWVDDVVLFTREFAPTTEESAKLAAAGVRVVTGEIAKIAIENDTLTGVSLTDGTTVPVQAVVTKPTFTANADILVSLGLEVTEMMMGDQPMGATFAAADQAGNTSVPGVFAAGNVAAPMENVIGSAAAGVRAAGGIVASFIEEDTRLQAPA
ncbi:NAD(P)/FAD-dependent oxidoreductase [Rhodococcoides kyotonense]|uniref:Thioredoxin reductase (NADPH) n=1 Tax=Rhodococcoides kyotonense TaxID=398843 RepID=A0A239KL99_9NOCA|nr:NAD(P)/FAD-dependent oxidoreductase [Rhodococcus kyotonensis]SNT17954.1 thioredoxin reductase (NADPH) [Rhodococcus kyotonensis]